MDGLANRRIELFINPKPYDRTPILGQPRRSLAPTVYFLWGYDMATGANVLALRVIPRTSAALGIVGWRIDVTIERRGPVWRWRRLHHEWGARAKSQARYIRFIRRHRRARDLAA